MNIYSCVWVMGQSYGTSQHQVVGMSAHEETVDGWVVTNQCEGRSGRSVGVGRALC